MNNVITPNHPRAPFIACLVDGVTVYSVAHIDIDNKEISVFTDDGLLTYKDLEGNSIDVSAPADSLDCTFKPRRFKAYDLETNEVYAEWDTYD